MLTQVTGMLDTLLGAERYNNELRPGPGGDQGTKVGLTSASFSAN